MSIRGGGVPWCLQADNTFLDHKNFAAFGTVTWNLELMQRVINPTPGATDGVDQDAYYEHGNTCAATSTSFWEHFNFSLITQLCSAHRRRVVCSTGYPVLCFGAVSWSDAHRGLQSSDAMADSPIQGLRSTT